VEVSNRGIRSLPRAENGGCASQCVQLLINGLNGLDFEYFWQATPNRVFVSRPFQNSYTSDNKVSQVALLAMAYCDDIKILEANDWWNFLEKVQIPIDTIEESRVVTLRHRPRALRKKQKLQTETYATMSRARVWGV